MIFLIIIIAAFLFLKTFFIVVNVNNIRYLREVFRKSLIENN